MTGNFCANNERAALLGDDIKKIVEVIADKYMSDNPPCDYEYRAFFQDGFKSRPDGAVDIDLDKKYPDAKQGDYAFAAAEITRATAETGGIFITPFGAVTAYLNGKEVYKSHPKQEGHINQPVGVSMPWKKGKNILTLKIKKLASGFFGAAVSSNSPKWAPIIFDFPSKLINGAAGFAYSELIEKDTAVGCSLESLEWYPKKGVLPDGEYLSWSSFFTGGEREIIFSGNAKSPVEVYIDNKKFRFSGGGFSKKLKVSAGRHDVMLSGADCGFKINCELELPGNIMGTEDKFIYIKRGKKSVSYYRTLERLFFADGEYTYWKTKENADIRPCLKAPLFGKWSYPLGVTLNGLYKAGWALGREDITEYVKRHVLSCIRLYDYSVWDKKRFGYPNINQQLLWFEELDDIGSFGALMLEVTPELSAEDRKTVLKIAKRIARHIMKVQHRRGDGALYRIDRSGTQSMWADDLYMCVPFLINYYKCTGDRQYIDEAARQILLYKKYLFMPEEKILSHVYVFNMNSASGLAWGRGNGWAVYSLAETLKNLPRDSRFKRELTDFFRELSQGYLRYQAESGMWRQLINCGGSYEETSATAMILYAFSQAVGAGFAGNAEIKASADRAAKALINKCIDEEGNVYGVCRGSYCSFDEEYYKTLLWSTNDTHGIGIVMLALLEYDKRKEG